MKPKRAQQDDDLMLRARAGDRSAFAEIIRHYQQPLLNFFRRMGARTDEAEDLVQETFVRLFETRDKYQPQKKFRNYLYVLAKHAWADMARKNSRAPLPGGDAVDRLVASPSAPPGSATDVQSALETLSGKLRIVVVMNVFQGLKQAEIAEVLGIPVGTVKSRLHLAFKQLREVLDDD